MKLSDHFIDPKLIKSFFVINNFIGQYYRIINEKK